MMRRSLSRMTVKVSLLRPICVHNDGDDGGPASACQGVYKRWRIKSIFDTENKNIELSLSLCMLVDWRVSYFEGQMLRVQIKGGSNMTGTVCV
jgi:hypothetical protein